MAQTRQLPSKEERDHWKRSIECSGLTTGAYIEDDTIRVLRLLTLVDEQENRINYLTTVINVLKTTNEMQYDEIYVLEEQIKRAEKVIKAAKERFKV